MLYFVLSVVICGFIAAFVCNKATVRGRNLWCVRRPYHR
jgi:hypothetical protein